MIGNSRPEYVFIRISITALRLVAPLSITYLAAASYNAVAHGVASLSSLWWWSPFVGAYAAVEAGFYLFVYLPRSFHMQRDAIHPPRMSRAQRETLFHKCAASMTAESITGWFLRPSGLQIWRDNVVDWLLWALFSDRNRDARPPEWEDELKYYTGVMGEHVGYPLVPGNSPEIQCLRLTMDPVPMAHRPFFWYMLVGIVDTLSSIALYKQGFTHHNTRKYFHSFPPRPLLALFSRSSRDTETNIPYWYRPHRSPTKLPILFIHGIGIGLLPYIPFLRDLVVQDPDVGIIAIEILPISMRITAPPLDRDAMCAAITRILHAHGIYRVVLAGHSYGTTVSAHLLRKQWDSDSVDHPDPQTNGNEYHVTSHDGHNIAAASSSDLIAATLLIDPIPFLLHYPAVAYNFVYRQPRHANEWLLWYFASREPDTSRALLRHFFWFECILFREDVLGATSSSSGGRGPTSTPTLTSTSTSTSTLTSGEQQANKKQRPMPVTVSLSGRDQIIDARAIYAYLTGGKDPENEGECEGGEVAVRRGSKGKGRPGVPPSHWKQDGLEVFYFSEMDHATVVDTPRDRAPLLEALRRFVRLDAGEGECGDEGMEESVQPVVVLNGNLVDVE